LVEPSRTQSAIIRKYLEGHHVAAVGTGKEALEAVRRERPDVVLAALHLPDMGGGLLAEKVYDATKPAPPGLGLISSESESAETKALSKIGSAVLLKKPFTSEQLADALKVVTTRHTPPQGAAEFGRLSVLIVDDSAPARRHVRSVLAGLGISQFV